MTLVRALRLLAQWGTVADWSAATGSILAAAVALGIALHGNSRQDQRENGERQKAEDRARRRASRIQIEHMLYRSAESETDELQVMLSNKGSTDLDEVRWFAPLVVQYTDDGEIVSVRRAVGTTVTDNRNRLETSDHETLVPGQNRRIYVPVARGDGGDRDPTVAELVTWIDADGYRLCRVYPRNTNPRSRRVAVAGWAVVDDDYPNSTGGHLRELLERAEG